MAEPHVDPNEGSPPAAPRWVKLAGVILIVVILIVIIMHLTGNSPGGHTMPV